MRLVKIDHTKVNLLKQTLNNESYAFFCIHKDDFRRMIIDQGRQFWICVTISLKSYCLNCGLIELFDKETTLNKIYTGLIEDVIENADHRLTRGYVLEAHNLVEDIAVLFKHRLLIDEIQSTSHSSNPFHFKETRQAFRRLFRDPYTDKTLHLIKVAKTYKYLLHLGGVLFEVLRVWLDAPECDDDITLYWRPPIEKPFILFGMRSMTFRNMCITVNRYEERNLERTMFELQQETKDDKSMVNFKFDSDSGNAEYDAPEDMGMRSKKLSIMIQNQETKEVTKRVLRFPRWETKPDEMFPKECQGCQDHLECIRKRVVANGYQLPNVLEVAYEPNFHALVIPCTHCGGKPGGCNECDGSGEPEDSMGSLEEPAALADAATKQPLTRKALKQMKKKERRKRKKKEEKFVIEEVTNLEAQGVRIFVEECRKEPGFLEDLLQKKPKRFVGLPLDKQPGDTKKAGGAPAQGEKKEPGVLDGLVGRHQKSMVRIPNDQHLPRPGDTVNKGWCGLRILGDDEEITASASEVQSWRKTVNGKVQSDSGKVKSKKETTLGGEREEKARDVRRKVMKQQKLRDCGHCGKMEIEPRTFKKCQRCREEDFKKGKYYCSRECQVKNWKEMHRKEHDDHLERQKRQEETSDEEIDDVDVVLEQKLRLRLRAVKIDEVE